MGYQKYKTRSLGDQELAPVISVRPAHLNASYAHDVCSEVTEISLGADGEIRSSKRSPIGSAQPELEASVVVTGGTSRGSGPSKILAGPT